MEICMGMIGMQPSEFWNASVIEIHCAIEGFQEFNTSSESKPMDRDELEELMELYPD
jgi:hypothetical protein|tara:strand:+ start:1841 stop:2011 length:171 start_codon:yes stop_codon:yes gene_type:complete